MDTRLNVPRESASSTSVDIVGGAIWLGGWWWLEEQVRTRDLELARRDVIVTTRLRVSSKHSQRNGAAIVPIALTPLQYFKETLFNLATL